jgi:O-antigen ligase
MIRYTLLTLGVMFVIGIAWKDWFKSLCGVIAFMAIYLRKDMPTEMFGIQGLNPFNVMLLNLVLAWANARERERLRWDMPPYINGLLLLYLFVTLVAFSRMVADPSGLGMGNRELISNYFINTYKWVVPALLLYDGCRSRERFHFALLAILLIYVLLGIQAARQVPPTPDLSELERMSRERLPKQTGYHRVDLSTMFSGASWAIFASRVLLRRRSHRFWALMASLGVFYSQLLTAGRAGYATWCVIALVLCSLRWRRYLAAVPVVLLIVVIALPAVVDRMLDGIRTGGDQAGIPARVDVDMEKLLAGRADIWPFVIDKIKQRPFEGWGRQAQRRLGLAKFAKIKLKDDFGHPHNAYLELLLDTGFAGFVPVMTFFAVALYQSMKLFRDSRSPIFVAAGGTSMALILGWLGGSIGAQTFYPREGSVGLWCAIMLTFRVYNERGRVLARVRHATPQARLALVGAPLKRPQPSLQPERPSRQPALARRVRKSGPPFWKVPYGAPDTLDGQLWSRTA